MKKKRNHYIIGSGFIAKKFKKYQNFLKIRKTVIYAAGISNSSENNIKNLKKEIDSLKKFISSNKKKFVYISSYSVNDTARKKKKYVRNKIKIEKIIKNKVKNYLIIRLPEIVGFSKNPNTLTNFFNTMIIKKKPFVVYTNAKRNILDVDDAISNCIRFIKFNKKSRCTINIINKRFYRPLKIVKELEKILKIKGNYKLKRNKKLSFVNKDNLFFESNKNYLGKVLKKYYN